MPKNFNILYQNDSRIFESFVTKLDIPIEAYNLFYIYNLNGCTLIKTDLIYKFYLNTFFGEDNQNKYQKELISTMIKAIKDNDNTIKLRAETILKFFKYCEKLLLEPKGIDNIEVDIGKNALKNKLNKDYYLTNDNINNLVKKEKEKSNLINLVVKIYSNYDKNMLISLIKTENGKDYVKSLFQLIRERKLKLEDLHFENKDDLILFQKNLLSSVETKDELNNVLNLSENLTGCLKFISDNIKSICNVLDYLQKWYKWNNYELTIQVAKNEEKIDEIYDSLLSIIQYTKTKKIVILNLNFIFNNIVSFYANKNLEELCKIHKISSLCVKEGVSFNSISNFYNIIHNKGLNLIMQNKFSPQEIVQFMKTQDKYYYHENYINNEFRDPIIFTYIPITNKHNDYLKNIELLKKNTIWEIYSKSNDMLKKKFFENITSQIEKIIDIKSIFDIFPIKFIDREFTLQINNRLTKVLYLILEEKEENYNLIFDIFDKIFIINEYANLDLTYIFNLIASLNYVITSKYFFYLIKNQNLKTIFGKLKDLIIEFFVDQFKDKTNKGQNAESVISLLILCTDNNFRVSLLNKMNKMIMKEEEFYSKEEKENYLFFKLFFEKCKDLIKINEISTGIYLDESMLIKSKISTDLSENKIKYDITYNLMDKENTFYKKILVITDQDEKEAKKIYDKINESLKICEEKIKKFELIEEFYSLFYNNTKQEIINLLKNKIYELKQKNINEILDIKDEEFIKNDNFNYKEAIEESKDVKYKNSLFFMLIYKKNIEEKVDKSEDEIFKETKNNYKDSLTRIINQKESKESFFKIDFVEVILSVIKNPNNNLEKEILFLEKEFADLDKEDYIKNELLNDLTNFSNKTTTENLLKYIINIIDSFKKIGEDIEETEFSNNLKNNLETLSKDEVNGEEIKKAIEFLGKYEYDIKKETPITNFMKCLSGKKEAIVFIKTLKNANFEIRNLTEFMDENEQSHLQASDIDNLIDVFSFMNKIIDNKDIKTDEDFIKIFKKEFEDEKNNKDIAIKFHSYLSVFYEIIQLYQQYDENPEMTIEKVDKILKESKIEIKNKKDTDLIVFEIEYDDGKIIHSNELDELRNKILMSSSNNRRDLSKSFIDLIDNIKQLTKTLNILLKLGYPNNLNLVFNVKNSDAVLDNDDDDKILKLGQVVNNYKKINENFRKSIKDGYEKSPYLRLFYGKQFVSLNTKAVGKPIDISHLVNSVSSNKIKQTQIEYNYNFENSNSIHNINKFLEKLFKVNKVNIDDIYNKNQVLDNIGLKPGLYRKVKAGDYCDMIYNILNIYINITGNLPIPNTILLCNEETNIEKIKAFLYKALYCEKPIFFVIANIECLDFSITQVMTKTLKLLYKTKNKKINSYLLFFYEKVESGLAREIERLIPEKNILSNGFMKESRQDNEELKKIVLYSSKFSGYGKTTEIFYRIKEANGEYHYLPLGGAFSRDYVLTNLENLHLNFKNDKNIYLHLDLSETDNDELMNEILFKLLILKYVDYYEKVFYLGNEIMIIIEIPKGFVEFDKKYKLLNLFHKEEINELKPLRLEPNAIYVRDSPISIVAEVLTLYKNRNIGRQNIDLDKKIEMTPAECEKIINEYFQVENQNYYQKMNFIKILSIQFKKLTKNIYLNYDLNGGKEEIIGKARINVVKNIIELTKVFTRSPFDTILVRQDESRKLFGKYDDEQAKEDEIMALANEKQDIFSFEDIKPSLVFFNQDENSLSIISNSNKNDPDYDSLLELWNSNNKNIKSIEQFEKKMNFNDLIDRKKK